MARKAHNGSYEFVGIRDHGDAVIGPRDKIVLKDAHGQRHEFYLGDDQALAFLRELGVGPEEINGLSLGEAQERLAHLVYVKRAGADVTDVTKEEPTQRA